MHTYLAGKSRLFCLDKICYQDQIARTVDGMCQLPLSGTQLAHCNPAMSRFLQDSEIPTDQ